jgi:hypothetical protein
MPNCRRSKTTKYLSSNTVRRLALLLSQKNSRFRKWFRNKLVTELSNQLTLDAENDRAWHQQISIESAWEFLERNCARCGSSRTYHIVNNFGTHESGAICSEFIEPGKMTPEMMVKWEELVYDAEYSQAWEEYEAQKVEPDSEHSYDYSYDDDREMQDELYELEAERRCSWGEPVWLTYRHPVLGFTQLGMLEGEWLHTFGQWRKCKTLPEETIAMLEEEFYAACEQMQ